MSIVRWERTDAVNVMDSLTLDDLDRHVLVIQGVTAEDDELLHWCRRAPCVVIGCSPAGREPAASPDLALVGDEIETVLDPLLARITANPQACRMLVDVLRRMPGLDVSSGLTLESLAYSTLQGGAEFAAWLADQTPRPPRAFSSSPLRVDRLGDDLRVTLARPENRNAFSAEMRDALVEALTVAEVDDSVRSVVLTGDGPVFSSGGDLTEFGTTSDIVRAHEIRTQRSVGAVLARLAATTVLVQGACVGAGVEISAFADRVIADPAATFRLPEIAMGLIPGAGGTVSVTRRIGRQQCARLAILGEPIDAGRALTIGLVDEILPVTEERLSSGPAGAETE